MGSKERIERSQYVLSKQRGCVISHRTRRHLATRLTYLPPSSPSGYQHASKFLPAAFLVPAPPSNVSSTGFESRYHLQLWKAASVHPGPGHRIHDQLRNRGSRQYPATAPHMGGTIPPRDLGSGLREGGTGWCRNFRKTWPFHACEDPKVGFEATSMDSDRVLGSVTLFDRSRHILLLLGNHFRAGPISRALNGLHARKGGINLGPDAKKNK